MLEQTTSYSYGEKNYPWLLPYPIHMGKKLPMVKTYPLFIWGKNDPCATHKNLFEDDHSSKCKSWASLVAQWLRVRLPMQGTRVQALVWEDPACHGMAGPMCHNYWARVPQVLRAACLEPVLCNKRGHDNERSAHCSREWPLLATTGGSPRTATRTQRSQKQKQIN